MIDPTPLFTLDIDMAEQHPITTETADSPAARRLALLLHSAVEAGASYATIAHVLLLWSDLIELYVSPHQPEWEWLTHGSALLSRMIDEHLAGPLSDADRASIMAECNVLLEVDDVWASAPGTIGAVCAWHAHHLASAEPDPKHMAYRVWHDASTVLRAVWVIAERRSAGPVAIGQCAGAAHSVLFGDGEGSHV